MCLLLNPCEQTDRSAGRLFYAEGIQAVGVQRLIEEADVAKASLYAHFPSKDDVVTAYLAERGARLRAAVQRQVLDPALTPRARVLRFFDLIADWTCEPTFCGCPFQQAAAEVRDRASAARAETASHRAWMHDALVRLVRDAGAPDPEALAGMLQLLMDGAVAAAVIDGTGRQGQDARRAAEQLLDAAIGSAGGTASRPPAGEG